MKTLSKIAASITSVRAVYCVSGFCAGDGFCFRFNSRRAYDFAWTVIQKKKLKVGPYDNVNQTIVICL